MAAEPSNTTVEWPSENKKPDRHGPLAFLHQLAGDVVDCGDVIGVDGVAQAQTVGQQCGAEQHGIMTKGHERPEPGRHVEQEQDAIDASDLASDVA